MGEDGWGLSTDYHLPTTDFQAMHELFNFKSGKTIAFASDIDELTPEQYLYYLELAMKYMSGEIADVQELKRLLFVKLTNLKVSWKMHFYNPETREQIWAALAEKIDLLDSFFDIDEQPDGRKVYKMHLDSARNLLPEYKGWQAPDWCLDSITVGEFVSCIELLKQIRRLSAEPTEENEKAVNECGKQLFYNLYKPKPDHSVTSIRCSLRRTALSERNCGVPKLPESVIFHIINYFGYFVEIITTTPLVINGSTIDFSVLFPKSEEETEQKDGDIGWNGVIFSVAETGVFGNVEQIMKEKLISILLFLYKRHLDMKEQEKKLAEFTP